MGSSRVDAKERGASVGGRNARGQRGSATLGRPSESPDRERLGQNPPTADPLPDLVPQRAGRERAGWTRRKVVARMPAAKAACDPQVQRHV